MVLDEENVFTYVSEKVQHPMMLIKC